MATIENLPEEMLVMIFSHYIQDEGHVVFLRNIPLVCKNWNKLSTEAALWRNVSGLDLNLLEVSRRGLLKHTQSLEGFKGSYSYRKFSDILKNIRELKSLDLRDKNVGNDAIKLVTEHCAHLEHFCLEILEPASFHLFLDARGTKLKNLHLTYKRSQESGQQLVSGIAAKCPLLETLEFHANNVSFPIYELNSKCPNLTELELSGCRLITSGSNNSSGFSFKNLKKFVVQESDFGGCDVGYLLKDSSDLERLELVSNGNLVTRNIPRIPSEKVRVLDISYQEFDRKALQNAVFKWRRTLSVLSFGMNYPRIVLEQLLRDNETPQLESLAMCGEIDLRFFEKFIEKCQKLTHLMIYWRSFRGREKFKEALEFMRNETRL